jgi:hypothetical protein
MIGFAIAESARGDGLWRKSLKRRRFMGSPANCWSLRRLSSYSIPAIAALALTSSHALAAPSQLYGKSVIVSWSENRVQTTDRDAQPTSMTGQGQLSVYISDKGRPFSRVSMSVTNMRGHTRSGNRDAVQGEGSARSFSFSGNTMSASMPRGNAGAMQISVTFDSGFQSCSARVITGKTGGAQSTRVTSMITGRQYEFYSVKTSGESCRVQNGNVFGN